MQIEELKTQIGWEEQIAQIQKQSEITFGMLNLGVTTILGVQTPAQIPTGTFELLELIYYYFLACSRILETVSSSRV